MKTACGIALDMVATL